jgi:hypothetical protein
VRGYPNFQPPPIASRMPIVARIQACCEMQFDLAKHVATGESIRLLCHCPPDKRCHLQAGASSDVRALASSLASSVPPCPICDTNDGDDGLGAEDVAAPAAELSASGLFGHGGEDPQLPQLPSPQATPLFPPPIAGHGGAPPPSQQLPSSPQLMPPSPPVPPAQPLSAVLAHMASIAAGSTKLSPRQHRRRAVCAVRTAAHGTAARVLGSVKPSTWIALAFVYTLRRQAEESLPAIGRQILAAHREKVLILRATPPKPITWCDVGVTDELTLIYRDSRGRISAEHPAVVCGLIQRGAALAADGSCVVPLLPPQLPSPNSSFELCPDASGATCYLNRDLGTAQWDPPADLTPLQPFHVAAATVPYWLRPQRFAWHRMGVSV